MTITETLGEELRDAVRANISSEEEGGAVNRLIDAISDSMAPASTSASHHGGFDSGLLWHTVCVWRIAKGLFLGGMPAMNDTFSILAQSLGSEKWPAEKAAANLNGTTLGSLLKVCIIHDMNKIRTLNGTPFYVPNILKSGKRSEPKPWEVSDDANPIQTIQRFVQQVSLSSDHPGAPQSAATFLAMLDPNYITCRDGLVSLAVAIHFSPEMAKFITQSEKEAVIFHDGAYAGRSGISGKESVLQIILHAADMLASRFFC